MQVILDAARYLGWTCIHQFDSRRTAPGWPDIVCARDGRMVAIECKTERGKVTPAQEHWLALLGSVPGVYALVARPDDWDTVLAKLQDASQSEIPDPLRIANPKKAPSCPNHDDAAS